MRSLLLLAFAGLWQAGKVLYMITTVSRVGNPLDIFDCCFLVWCFSDHNDALGC